MGDLIQIGKTEKNDTARYRYEHHINKDGEIIGISYEGWPFEIQRKGDEIALVNLSDGEPFGILPHDVFNCMLKCWLIIDGYDEPQEEQK